MSESPASSGILYLVSTPIGNLADMTHRAVEILGGADLVLAEDTRHSRKLFTHYNIRNDIVAYHDHNKEKVTPVLIDRLESGETLALVSDAGTPGISDPGFYLLRAAIAAGIRVSVVPGASALLPALLMSGFPTDAFVFQGFLPRKKGELTRLFEGLADERRTYVAYVSPHKLLTVLGVLGNVLPQRELAIVREITKLYEETLRGTAADIAAHYDKRAVKGEFVLVMKGADKKR